MAPLKRACLSCGELTRNRPSYCDTCRPAPRPPRDRGTTTEQGYGWSWQKLRARAIRRQPWCTVCGTRQNLTVDHSPEAWREHDAGREIPLHLVTVMCHRCNVQAGPARGPEARQDDDTLKVRPRSTHNLRGRQTGT